MNSTSSVPIEKKSKESHNENQGPRCIIFVAIYSDLLSLLLGKKKTSSLNKARVSWKSLVWFPWELGAKALTACCYFPLTLLRDIFSKTLLHRRHDRMNSMPQLMVWGFLMLTIRTNLSKKIYWKYSRYLRVKGIVEQLGLRKERMEAALGIWVVSAENCHLPALHRSLSV